MMKFRIFVLLCFVLWASIGYATAEEIFLSNGDRISGKIVNESDEKIIIETEAMGQIVIDRNFVKSGDEEKKESEDSQGQGEIKWERKASFGYSQTGGNTEDSQGSVELNINRNSGHDEWTGALKAFVSTSNDQMDAKKFYGMGRYAFSFADQLKWYHFYKFEADQDQFANIDYRLIPSTGVGYWFSDTDEWKLMLEGAIGYEHTNYRDNTKSQNEAVLIPRAFLETRLIGSLKLSEDIILYPSIGEVGEYRLHSETALINPINEQISWKVSFIDDFNSDPSGSTKRNDFRLISSVDYAF